MDTLKTLIIVVALTMSAAAYAQTVPTTPTSPTTPQTVPTQDPTSNPTTEKKEEFNSPQSPVRPSNTPSEDTLIKSQRVGGAVIQDTLVPASGKKKDKMNRKKDKMSDRESDKKNAGTVEEGNKIP